MSFTSAIRQAGGPTLKSRNTRNKGYAFVFDKRATLAGGTDVTSDVIARLDRKM